jgi:hypothetical protein
MNYLKILFLSLILGLSGCLSETETEDNIMPNLSNKKAWSTSGNLISGAGDSGNGVSLQANFIDEPGNYTVQFGIQAPDISSGPARVIKAVAEITWSVEGNDVRRLVDCVNGMSVTGTAQAVKVRVFDNSVGGAALEYQISIQVIKGTRPSVAHPPFLSGQPRAIADADQLLIPIPQNAGVTSVMVLVGALAVPVPPGVTISHESAVTLLAIYEARDYQWVPIAAGANSIFVANGSGVGISATPIWGIDG